MVSVVRFDRQQNTQGTLYYHVVQVVSNNFTAATTFSSPSQAYQVLSGGSLTITPLYTGSKFQVMVSLQGYISSGQGVNAGISRTLAGTTTRLVGSDSGANSGDTWMGSGNGVATNSWTLSRHFLDTPGVSAGVPITYNSLGGIYSGGTVYFNYNATNGLVSNITVWEIQP
jgi:hypothetical protein